MKMSKTTKKILLSVVILVITALATWVIKQLEKPYYSKSVKEIPAFSGEPYVVINNNEPEFDKDDLDTDAYEFYSELDRLGRCGYAMACIGPELIPTEERESIGQVKPSGWQTVKYEFVDGKYLYNRCHLIGYQLTGENANACNLITGTRYLNVVGMLPFENMIADYIKETDNHVLYRVTPIFQNDELVARGVQMEAFSLEDNGEGICFNVYAYNNQPGVRIDYATGNSVADDSALGSGDGPEEVYILNTNSRKFHTSDCEQGKAIKDSNKQAIKSTRDLMIAQGYEPSGCCDP